MKERRIGGPIWAQQEGRTSLKSIQVELPNPGKVVLWQERIFIVDENGSLVPAQGHDAQKARILFQDKK